MRRSLKAVERNKMSNSAGRMSISIHELPTSSVVECGCAEDFLGDNEGILASPGAFRVDIFRQD